MNEINEQEKKESMPEEKTHATASNIYLLPASILIAGIMISTSVVYLVGQQGTTRVPSQNQDQIGNGDEPTAADIAKGLELTARDVILGDPKAPVTVIEYGDYQCPFCTKFAETIEPALREKYIKTNKVKMIFRNFQFLGPESLVAAEAASCAADQQKFWTYHDSLYAAESADGQEHNGNLNRDLFLKLAADAKLDVAAFTTCFDTHKHKTEIAEDRDAAQSIGVNSTPTSFVNGEKIDGALPFSQFQQIIENALAKK